MNVIEIATPGGTYLHAAGCRAQPARSPHARSIKAPADPYAAGMHVAECLHDTFPPPRPPAFGDPPATLTARQFTALLPWLGVRSAYLEDHGCGAELPTCVLADGTGVIVSSDDGYLPHPDLPMDAGLDGDDGFCDPAYAKVSAVRYESAAVNAARWEDGQGLDFNDPVDVSGAGTPLEALAAVARWAADARAAEPPASEPAGPQSRT